MQATFHLADLEGLIYAKVFRKIRLKSANNSLIFKHDNNCNAWHTVKCLALFSHQTVSYNFHQAKILLARIVT